MISILETKFELPKNVGDMVIFGFHYHYDTFNLGYYSNFYNKLGEQGLIDYYKSNFSIEDKTQFIIGLATYGDIKLLKPFLPYIDLHQLYHPILIEACKYRYMDIIQLIDEKIIDKELITPIIMKYMDLDYIINYCHSNRIGISRCLSFSAMNKNIEVLKWVLADRVFTEDGPNYALNKAIMSNNVEAIKILIPMVRVFIPESNHYQIPFLNLTTETIDASIDVIIKNPHYANAILINLIINKNIFLAKYLCSKYPFSNQQIYHACKYQSTCALIWGGHKTKRLQEIIKFGLKQIRKISAVEALKYFPELEI